MNQVGVVVIGAGFIARRHLVAYRAAASRVPHTVVGIVDPVVDRAEALAREYGIPNVYESISDALRSPAEAVDICTPTPCHASDAVAALEAGRHVLIEKPIALTLEDADAIVAASDRAGTVAMVGHSARFGAIGRKLQDLKLERALGSIGVVEIGSLFGYFWEAGWRAWQIDPARSGGHIVHNGIHDIDLACWLLDGAPSDVYARGTRLASSALDICDSFHVLMSWENGACATVSLSYSVVPAGASMRWLCVTGTDGEASYASPGDRILWRGGGAELPIPDLDDAFEHEIAHWLECIVWDRTPSATPSQGRAALATALAAEASLRDDRCVPIAESEYR